MKLGKFYFAACMLCAVSAAKGQVSAERSTHNISAGPIAGYNLNNQGFAYGANLLYEYRPFEKIGFISQFSYERTWTDASWMQFGTVGDTPILGDNRFEDVYALSLGLRYYMKNFYAGGTAGLGYDNVKTTIQGRGVSDGGNQFGFYKSLAVGYQIQLKNQDALEFEAGLFGTRQMKLGGTVRYRFQR
ncbi:hypothetical protein PQ465_16825 [Sphingobacterium oryzagri]|uniref:Outer membrane protein beta-barrel domain-containing protein n=1 Tax=Sphingobacterium oryzagri TaxID=3025669 RepID=A0ABY7WE82_9SPHI|nr:hypothetical protein [Sphingobacterium sp. KACC 22765]WDF67953.1 hypothetical protein PQ465_16825 [Sphingobacterium sp. KACC 22765]